MNSEIKQNPTLPLAEQRVLLRRKIRLQRDIIEQQLTPPEAQNGVYPRSNIMRFLNQRPGLAGKLALEFGALFVGGRFIKSIAKTVGFAKILQSTFNNK